MIKQRRMSSQEAHAFLNDRTLHALDPDTREAVARVTYGGDGTCHAVMVSGESTPGVWGLTDTGYWTQYERFRDGERHEFTLVLISDRVAQAYFADGRRAFLQTPDLPEL